VADFTLFRGRVMRPRVANMGGGAARVTLDCEDYNGLFDKIAVGAPSGDIFLTQDDGTALAIDPEAVAGTMISMLGSYWVGQAPIALVGAAIDDTYILADAPPGVPVLQWYTGMTTLGAALDDMAAHVSGAVRYWIDPDLRPHWTSILPSDAVIGSGGTGTLSDLIEQQAIMLFPAPSLATIVDAPAALGPVAAAGTIIPMQNSIEWDYSSVRWRAYVQGSTLQGSGWAPDGAISPIFGSGEEYIDAPGSIYVEDKDAIARWHGQQNFRDFAVGRSTIAPGQDGWRVGQTLVVTDPVLSLFIGSPASYAGIVNKPFTIQQVTGTLKARGAPLGIRLGVIDATTMVSFQELTWTETLDGGGTATVALELLNELQGDTLPTPMLFSIPPACDIEIWIPDGTEPVIEYELSWGDIPPGAISRQLAKIPEPEPPKVVYRFIVEIADPAMPPGQSCAVSAQLADGGGAAVKLSGVPMEWVVISWDVDANPATGVSLADDVGTTDAGGRVFTTLTLAADSTAKSIEVSALALPIA
jgi:hypothetical protein